MKNTDISINNYLIDYDRIIQVKSINGDFIEYLPDDGQYEICKLKSIELTKDWLLKFNFNEDKKGLFLNLLKGDSYVKIRFMFNKFPLVLDIDGNRCPLFHLKSVHQLQIFASGWDVQLSL